MTEKREDLLGFSGPDRSENAWIKVVDQSYAPAEQATLMADISQS
jgi:hypothetical protein